jgi:hypothetical protein
MARRAVLSAQELADRLLPGQLTAIGSRSPFSIGRISSRN